MEEIDKYLQQIQSVQRYHDAFQRAYSPIANSIVLAQESYSRYLQNFQTQIQMAMQPYINQTNLMQQQFLQHMQPYIETVNRIREYTDLIAKVSGPISFNDALREVYYEYERIQSIEATVDQEEALDAYFDSIATEVKGAPKSALSIEFYISLVLSLILYIASQQSSNESEARLQARFNKLETTISSLTKQIDAANESSFYIVDRTAILRAAPNNNSAIIGKLPIDLKVEVLEKRKIWIKIQYFSSRDRVLLDGWVLKKYLYRINMKKTNTNLITTIDRKAWFNQ